MKFYNHLIASALTLLTIGCMSNKKELKVEVYETSASGNQLTKVDKFSNSDSSSVITIKPEETFQTITGFGGAFTESSAYLLNKLSKRKS